jgi:hypothetical protein
LIRYKNIVKCFPTEDGFLMPLVKTLERARRCFPDAIKKPNGTHVLQGFTADGMSEQGFTPIWLNDCVRQDQDGSSRLMVMTFRDTFGTRFMQLLSTPDTVLRIDIPLHFAYDEAELKKYVVYHIRFKISEDDPRFTEETSLPLRRGYIGITGRWFFTRFLEHEKKARMGEGFLFHSAWNMLLKENVSFHPTVQICATADTLKEIYAMEEEAVAKFTLAPLGLNAIPGGMAGIRMMHELRLLNSLKVGVDERDAAIERLQKGGFAHGSPCAHYRRGHMRKLADEKLTWVSPCWVNLKEMALT